MQTLTEKIYKSVAPEIKSHFSYLFFLICIVFAVSTGAPFVASLSLLQPHGTTRAKYGIQQDLHH